MEDMTPESISLDPPYEHGKGLKEDEDDVKEM